MQTRANGKQRTQRSRDPIYVVPFTNASGSSSWRVSGMHKAKQVRENFKTEAEALARKDELMLEHANIESSVVRRPTRLTEAQVREAEVAYGELGTRSMLAAARFYLENYRDPVNKITVEKAFDKFIEEKELNNLRADSIRNLKVRVGFLVKAQPDRLVSDILSDHVKEIIFKSSRSAVTSDNVRRAISSFFTWAAEHKFCASNPMAAIKPIKTDRDEPETLTVAQARNLIAQAAAYKDGVILPYMALGLFAAIRPTELARITWENIDLEAGTITIGAKMAKMRQRRIVDMVCLTEKDKQGKEQKLPANLVDWLTPHAVKKTPIKGVNWRRDFDAVKAAAGWGTETEKRPGLKPWTQDIMRHTAISNHLAHFQHEGKTAAYRTRMVVVVAGYTGRMKEFIDQNPGLQSRFNRYVGFPDYDPGELFQIFQHMAAAKGYVLDQPAQDLATRVLKAVHAKRDDKFGNARTARNLFECTMSNQADRLAAMLDPPDKQMLVKILKEDIPVLEFAPELASAISEAARQDQVIGEIRLT